MQAHVPQTRIAAVSAQKRAGVDAYPTVHVW